MLGTGERRVGFVLPFSLLGCFRGLSNISRALFFEACQLQVSAQLADRKGFQGAHSLDARGSLQLPLPSCGKEINAVKVHSVWGVWNGFLLEKARDEEVKCRFCGG